MNASLERSEGAVRSWLGLLLSLMFVLSMIGCGGGEEGTPTPPAAEKAVSGDVGKTIQSDE